MRRILLFVLVGGTCGLLQIAILAGLTRSGNIFSDQIGENIANVLAFALSVQLNFILSSNLTWKDKVVPGASTLRLYFSFNAMMLGTLVVNQLVFALSNLYLPALVAGMFGIASAAVTNFVISGNFVFQR